MSINEKIALALFVGPGDVQNLNLWCISYSTFVDPAENMPVYVITPQRCIADVRKNMQKHMSVQQVQFVSDEDVYRAMGGKSTMEKKNNWFNQQVLKIGVGKMISDADFVVVFDSDCFFKRRLTQSALKNRNGKVLSHMNVRPKHSDTFSTAVIRKSHQLLYPGSSLPPDDNPIEFGVTPQVLSVEILCRLCDSQGEHKLHKMINKGATEYGLYYAIYKHHNYDVQDMSAADVLVAPDPLIVYKPSAVYHWDVPRLMEHPSLFGLFQSNLHVNPDFVLDQLPFSSPHLFKPTPTNALPAVTCLMVTKDRLAMVKNATNMFLAQTYPQKKLLVVTDGYDGTREYVQGLKDPRVTCLFLDPSTDTCLGKLRNISVDAADTPFVMQWDDDDWYHPSRISMQMKHLLDNNADAVLLSTWTNIWPAEGAYAISNRRTDGWEGSILVRKSIIPKYSEKRRGEDTDMTNALWKNKNVKAVLLDDSEYLYGYAIHANNTWDRPHFLDMLRISTSLEGKYVDNPKEATELYRMLANRIGLQYTGYNNEIMRGTAQEKQTYCHMKTAFITIASVAVVLVIVLIALLTTSKSTRR